jgi:predicted RNase H-like HicB family nuclease
MSGKYSIHLVWSDADNAFIAAVPELPGCMADGATREEALKALDTVVAEWIETAEAIGRTVPKPICRESMEKMDKAFHKSVQEHIAREVETAVQRVLRELSFSAAFAGRFDSSESWKLAKD